MREGDATSSATAVMESRGGTRRVAIRFVSALLAPLLVVGCTASTRVPVSGYPRGAHLEGLYRVTLKNGEEHYVSRLVIEDSTVVLVEGATHAVTRTYPRTVPFDEIASIERIHGTATSRTLSTLFIAAVVGVTVAVVVISLALRDVHVD